MARRGLLRAAMVGLAVAVTVALGGAAPGFAHVAEQHPTAPPPPAAQTALGATTLRAASRPRRPRVGTLARLEATLEHDGIAARATRFWIEIENTESDTTTFRGRFDAPDGHLDWRHQFFDAAPHRVAIRATALEEPPGSGMAPAGGGGPTPPSPPPFIETELYLSVEGVEPPLSLRLRLLGFLVAAVAVAMTLGYGLGVRPR